MKSISTDNSKKTCQNMLCQSKPSFRTTVVLRTIQHSPIGLFHDNWPHGTLGNSKKISNSSSKRFKNRDTGQHKESRKSHKHGTI